MMRNVSIIICFLIFLSWSLSAQNRAIFEIDKYISFSIENELDHFKVRLDGNEILNSKVIITIYNSKQKLLYKTEFSSNALLIQDHEGANEDKIKLAFNDLLSDKHFIENPLAFQDEYDLDYYENSLSEEEWREIKNDSSIKGFQLQLFEGGITTLIYLKRSKIE